MKKDGGKIAVMALLSLLVAVGTLVGAAVLADINSKTFLPKLPSNDYSFTPSSSNPSGSESTPSTDQSEPPPVDEGSSNNESSSELDAEIPLSIETGIYTLNESSIVIASGEAGFVEGNINANGITMEFSGQTVDGTLVATGTDSLNNTVEVTLVFGDKTINASSRPVIQYEEAEEYLAVSGIFVK